MDDIKNVKELIDSEPDRWEGPLSLDELHGILLQMMVDFRNYCDENDIKYYLCGGKLLGAVRHNGFIPWDDDVDIGMPRPDYEKFLMLVHKKPVGDRYEVLSGDEGTFSIPYGVMVNKDVIIDRATAEYILPQYLNHHLFVDLFPMDAWPDTDEEGERLSADMKKLNRKILNSRAMLFHGTNIARAIAKTPEVLSARMKGNSYYVRQMIDIAHSFGDYQSAQYVGSITCCLNGMGERMTGENARKYLPHDFEGETFMIPGSYDEYLHGKYGDYMQIPPESQRITHRMKIYRRKKYVR